MYKYSTNMLLILIAVYVPEVLTLYTADPAAAKAANRTPVMVFFLFVMPASM